MKRLIQNKVRSRSGLMWGIWFLLLAALYSQDTKKSPEPVSSVGMQNEILQIVIPGSELKVIPLDDRKTPIVLRIKAVWPHGSEFRYDFVYYGLDPGNYNLKDYLQRIDGSDLTNVPELPVEISSVLPAGRIRPNPLGKEALPVLGSYKNTMTVISILWVVGLVALVVFGRFRKAEEIRVSVRGETLADRLKPMVEKAMHGEMSMEEQAALERLMLTFWQKRLNLQEVRAAQAILKLKEHDEAGPIFRALEDWLHRPDPVASEIKLAELLEPYRNLPAEELEETLAS
ncbi:MAG TPA: hypothetical protein EYQ50_23130 [Verrucomicrobiales bacterium]|nr:hypothetical protein [Verrucomicrobiales bacterium]HIL70698.1 hypothetical protein [Verrucomicrobiota bacterium]